MLPFLVGEVQITGHDGTVVRIGSGKASDDSGSESTGANPATSQTAAPSKHHRSGSDGMDGTVVPIVAIVFVFLWLIIKALMAPFTQRASRRGQAQATGSEALSEEEQAVLLKLQRTIGQMESRIESLETILVEEHRTKEKYGNKI